MPISFPDVHDGVPIGIDRNLRVISERLQFECPHSKGALAVPGVLDWRPCCLVVSWSPLVCETTVYLQTSAAGDLSLTADSESSRVRTFFGKLATSIRNPVTGNREPCILKVDAKMLVGCLQWQQSAIATNVANAIMSFAEDDMLVIHVTLNPSSLGFFTYNLPVQYISEDDP
jgi:hypothetical protein